LLVISWSGRILVGLSCMGVGIFIAVVAILYLRQGAAYIPTDSWLDDDDWCVAREDHPVLFRR
jgi:hypothetical protein